MAAVIALFALSFSGNLVYAYTSNGAVTASVNVPASCAITLSPTTLDFGSIAPQANVPTNNVVGDSNGGDIVANILVKGTDWSGTPGSFGVSNTLWDASTDATYTGNQLTNALVITSVIIGTTGTNDIYFGLGVPAGTAAGIYSQTITIENSC